MDTYSREFLQSLPEKKKYQEIKVMISTFSQLLLQNAENGQTSYFFDMSNIRRISPSDINTKQGGKQGGGIYNPIPATTMANEEIAQRFQAAFPDCSVKYDEQWVETNASTKVFKRGITIDWS